MVNTRFWNDSYISNLDPIEKLMFLYILTNDATNISGIYELPLRNIAFDTGLDKDMVQKILNRFSDEGKVFYINGWVCIKNFQKHQNQRSPKIQAGIVAELELIPKDVIELAEESGYGIDTLSHSNTNSTELNSTKKGAGKTPPNPQVKEFIDFFSLTVEKIRGIKPTIDGMKDASNVKRVLGKQNMTIERLEKMTIWYLIKKKKRQNSKGDWFDEFKNSPTISTMLSNSYFNELLSEEKNAHDYLQENLKWVEKVYAGNNALENLQRDIVAKFTIKRYELET